MIEFIQEELNRHSIFIDETKLSTDFIPECLLYREEEFKQLTQVYLSLIKMERFSSRNTILTGMNGSGKTALAKRFGLSFERIASDFHKNIKYVHVNCRIMKSNYVILKKILQSLGNSFPEKGFSLYELITLLKRILNENNVHLLLTLDEMNFLDVKNDNLIYMLTRINEEEMNVDGRVSIIGIEKNMNFIQRLDLSTISSFQYNLIALKPYDAEQIEVILKFRAELSITKTACPAEIIGYIAKITSRTGDMRYSLEILYKAGKCTDQMGLSIISAECVRHALAYTFEHFDFNTLDSLVVKERLLLLSACRALKKNKTSSVLIDELKRAFRLVCEEANIEPLGRSQFYDTLHRLKDMDFISVLSSNPRKKGQVLAVSIDRVPVEVLEQEILKHARVR